MKLFRTFAVLVVILANAVALHAFDKTLRIDYQFIGGRSTVSVALSSMSCTDGWYGRTVNMDRVPVEGNGDIRMVDDASGEILYANSFSTLFQEWLTSDEAGKVVKSYENTFLLPMPRSKATVYVRLFDNRRKVVCEYSHPVNPDDILVEKRKVSDVERRYIYKSGDSHEKIDVVILAEGYTARERELFYRDAGAAVESLFDHEPFGRYRRNFNVLAVAAESQDSGVSEPGKGIWKNTAVGSHFNSMYMDRYLTTENIFRLHDILDGLPYEHIIILANTDTYGGGGIYNSYTLTTAHHKLFRPVVVHEFGHSFGALADEYVDNGYEGDPFYFSDIEPWEKNVTTKTDFASKWKDMIDSGVKGVGLVEGAGYQPKGVWRSAEDCRMRTNKADAFCKVCQRAVEDMILFNTEQGQDGKFSRPGRESIPKMPAFLKKGDRIAMIAPAYAMDDSLVKASAGMLSDMGYQPVIGKNALKRYPLTEGKGSRFAGTPEERQEDLLWALRDTSIKGIICLTGGYGAIHTLSPEVMEAFRCNPKWFVGCSDITSLLMPAVAAGSMCIHGNMCIALATKGLDDEGNAAMLDILGGKLPRYEIPADSLNEAGEAEGILVGGNMTNIVPLLGTPYDCFTGHDCILFIEEVGESMHCIDRQLSAILLHHRDRIKGVVVGDFVGCGDDLRYSRVEEMLSETLKNLGIPVCYGFPAGHARKNMPLIEGAQVRLKVDGNSAVLEHLGSADLAGTPVRTKVMSFNIRICPTGDFDGSNNWKYRRDAVAALLNSRRPDLFGIQEGLFDQVNFIEKRLPDYGRYGAGHQGNDASGEANAIFWRKDRYSPVECGTFWLSETPDTESLGWDGSYKRVVVWGHFLDNEAGGRDVYFFNTHFDHIGKKARKEEGKLIVEKIKEIVPEGAPVFLTGDFNANYDDRIFKPLLKYLDMSRLSAPQTDFLNTYHEWGVIDSGSGGNAIDHIFYRNAVPLKYETVTSQYGATYVSDHFPVMTTYGF